MAPYMTLCPPKGRCKISLTKKTPVYLYDLWRETMWNQFRTDEYQGMLAETITMPGHKGDFIHAYFSRPLGKGPFPGVILIPHMPK